MFPPSIEAKRGLDDIYLNFVLLTLKHIPTKYYDKKRLLCKDCAIGRLFLYFFCVDLNFNY